VYSSERVTEVLELHRAATTLRSHGAPAFHGPRCVTGSPAECRGDEDVARVSRHASRAATTSMTMRLCLSRTHICSVCISGMAASPSTLGGCTGSGSSWTSGTHGSSTRSRGRSAR